MMFPLSVLSSKEHNVAALPETCISSLEFEEGLVCINSAVYFIHTGILSVVL